MEILAAVVAILLFSLGDALAAAWGKTGQAWYFVLMILVGNLAWILFAWLNKSWPLATVSGVVNVGLALMGIAIGFVVFREKLLPLEKIGLVLGLLSLLIFALARTQPSSDTPSPSPQDSSAQVRS